MRKKFLDIVKLYIDRNIINSNKFEVQMATELFEKKNFIFNCSSSNHRFRLTDLLFCSTGGGFFYEDKSMHATTYTDTPLFRKKLYRQIAKKNLKILEESFLEESDQSEINEMFNSFLRITKELLESASNDISSITPEDKALAILDYVKKVSKGDYGEKVNVMYKNNQDTLRGAFNASNWLVIPYSYCNDSNEVFQIVKGFDYFVAKNEVSGTFSFSISNKGWEKLAEKKSEDSNRAFVAMWFGDSLNEVYKKAIRPAIKEAGYEPIRIDEQPHNDRIDNRIIAEIRRCKFVVCDFTADQLEGGTHIPRGGVYFEAGFATGLDKTVIWTCRKDQINEIHFDTRQFNYILWKQEKLGKFKTDLLNRIKATIT